MRAKGLLGTLGCYVWLAVALTGCGGGGSGGDGAGTDPASAIAARTLYTNPGDAALYQLTVDSGEQTTWYGTRDSNGAAASLDTIDYVDADGRQFLVELGPEGWPERVTDPDGLIVEFDYGFAPAAPTAAGQSAQRAAPAESSSISASEISSISASVSVPGSSGPQQMRTQLSLGSPIVVARNPALEAERAGDPVGNLDIFVSQCGDPSDAAGRVAVDFRGVNAPLTVRYPARKTSRLGHYVTTIPRRTGNATLTTKQYCNAFADKLSVLCSLFSQAHNSTQATAQLSNPALIATICGQLAIYASGVATPVVGTSVGAACTAMLTAGPLVCSTLGQSGSPLYDATNVANLLCGPISGAAGSAASLLESVERGGDLARAQIQAIADFSNVTGGSQTQVLSEIQDVSLFDPFPSLSINSLLLTVANFTTYPETPLPGQVYVAQADFGCAFGAQLQMDVFRDGQQIPSSFAFGNETTTRMQSTVPADPFGAIDVLRFRGINNLTSATVENSFTVPLQTTVSASVTVSATDADATEPDQTGTFRVTRTGDTSAPLSVQFTLGGSASSGDYRLAPVAGSAVVIGAGAASADITLTPVDDLLDESTETVVLTLLPGIDYRVASPDSATVSLEDNDPVENNDPTFGSPSIANCPDTFVNGSLSEPEVWIRSGYQVYTNPGEFLVGQAVCQYQSPTTISDGVLLISWRLNSLASQSSFECSETTKATGLTDISGQEWMAYSNQRTVSVAWQGFQTDETAIQNGLLSVLAGLVISGVGEPCVFR